MGKGNGRSKHKRRPIDDPFHFPTGVASWLLANAVLVDSLIALRELGPDGEDAVEALLGVRTVAVFRASVELYYQLAITEGLDPQEEMDVVIPRPVFDSLRYGIWGLEPEHCELHVV